jgi:hypothetical protein
MVMELDTKPSAWRAPGTWPLMIMGFCVVVGTVSGSTIIVDKTPPASPVNLQPDN